MKEIDMNNTFYTLCVTYYKKDEKFEGFYAFDFLPFILKDLKNQKRDFGIYYIEDYENAQKLAQYYARIFREELRNSVKQGKHTQTGRFYVKKISNLDLKVKKIVDSKIKEHISNYNFLGDTSKIKLVYFDCKNK